MRISELCHEFSFEEILWELYYRNDHRTGKHNDKMDKYSTSELEEVVYYFGKGELK